MTPEQFTYWLQGFMEVSNPSELDARQVQIIKDHLATVFTKVTPDRSKVTRQRDRSLEDILQDGIQRDKIRDQLTQPRSPFQHAPVDLSALKAESAEVEYRPADVSAGISEAATKLLMGIAGVEGISKGAGDKLIVFVTNATVGRGLPPSIDGKTIELRVTSSIVAR